MSKAFVKEDDTDDGDEPSSPALSIPQGSKNYITPQGAQKLKDELHYLLTKERPKVTATVSWAASNGDRSENADYIYGKRRLREIDRRIRFLTKRIEAFEIVAPELVSSDQVLFGATVSVEDEEGQVKTYSIVGIDESDPTRGLISWISPLARALLKAKKGDLVSLKTPKGMKDLEVVEIIYKEIIGGKS